MSSILAIDPGPERSAWVEFEDGLPVEFGLEPNEDVLGRIGQSAASVLAIESVASYGMPVGVEVFETCVWSGRFIQQWEVYCSLMLPQPSIRRIYRRDVKLHLCGQSRAKDKNVRLALIDRYGPGKEKAVGVKANPGPLYGIKADIWAALGVAVTASEVPA